MATPATDIELRELLNAVNALSQRVEVGFAQANTKLAGRIDVIDERTKLGFWGFVGRGVIISLLGFLILMAIKYALTGTIKFA
jgi:hypothetical protein